MNIEFSLKTFMYEYCPFLENLCFGLLRKTEWTRLGKHYGLSLRGSQRKSQVQNAVLDVLEEALLYRIADSKEMVSEGRPSSIVL